MNELDALDGASNLSDDEFLALYHDLPWYSENAPLLVKHKVTTELSPLRWNAAQRYLWAKQWEWANDGRLVRSIVPKARQLGVTTIGLAHKVHVAETREHREMMVLLHDLKLALPAWRRMEIMAKGITNLPRAAITKSNDGRILEFETGSSIIVESVAKAGVGRGGTLHHVHATELPSWDDPEKVMDGIEEAVPELGMFESSITLESTSEGVGDWWYWAVQKAKRGQGIYQLIFLPWWIEPAYGGFDPKPWDLDEGKLRRAGLKGWSPGCGVPLAHVLKEPLTDGERRIAVLIERQAPSYGVTYLTEDLIVAKMLWRRRKIQSRGIDKFKQEYPMDVDEGFLGTGRPVFRPETVQFHKNRVDDAGADLIVPARQRLEVVQIDTKFDAGHETQIWVPRASDEGPLHVWKGPEKGARYVIGGDPSAAVKDPSALQILKLERELIEQVAVFHGHIGQIELAWITALLAQMYNNAAMVPEATGEGSPYVEQLARIRWRGKRMFQREVIGPGGTALVKRWGFDMNAATRPAVIESIYQLLSTAAPVFRHEETMIEMEQFRLDNKGRPDHPAGGHSDLLMAWGIAAYARNRYAAPKHKPRTVRGMQYETSKERRVRTRAYADEQ